MRALTAVPALLLINLVLWDAFETIVLPRRVQHKLRLTRLFYRRSWQAWRAVALRVDDAVRRETVLSVFGPLSLLVLLGVWALSLIVAFGLLQWAAGGQLSTAGGEGRASLGTCLYESGTSFITLGLGDVSPRSTLARWITVAEAASGFAFLALVIGFLPVLYQSFARREVSISLLDARAGSPPRAIEFLRRCDDADRSALNDFLRDWERWSAELLESHLSYPSLLYYRSQHEHQSWVAALTLVLDLCALLVACEVEEIGRQARLTFAMARHAAVDLGQVFVHDREVPAADRLPADDCPSVLAAARAAGLPVRDEAGITGRLTRLRAAYEPFVLALEAQLLMPLPPWLPSTEPVDSWMSSELGDSVELSGLV